MISLIACIDSAFGIGKNGKMPWPTLKNDLEFFKTTTLGHNVVVGRKTFESIGILKERNNIIYRGQLQEILDLAKNDKVFIIGGEKVYREFLSFADEIYLTRIINKIYDCDTFFPLFNPLPHWKCYDIAFYNEKGISYFIEQYIKIV